MTKQFVVRTDPSLILEASKWFFRWYYVIVAVVKGTLRNWPFAVPATGSQGSPDDERSVSGKIVTLETRRVLVLKEEDIGDQS